MKITFWDRLMELRYERRFLWFKAQVFHRAGQHQHLERTLDNLKGNQDKIDKILDHIFKWEPDLHDAFEKYLYGTPDSEQDWKLLYKGYLTLYERRGW